MAERTLARGTGSRQTTLRRLQTLSRLLDSSFKIPIINRRIGLDPILGLIPGVGDALTLLPAGYIIFEAYRLGAPRRAVVRMIANVGVETLVGTVPILGDIFDAAFKANTRNLYLLERHVGPLGERPLKQPSSVGLTWFLIVLLVLCAIGVGFAVWFGLWLFQQILQRF